MTEGWGCWIMSLLLLSMLLKSEAGLLSSVPTMPKALSCGDGSKTGQHVMSVYCHEGPGVAADVQEP